MRTIVFRALSGALGIFATLIAVAGPLMFLNIELIEANSARQYGAHPSIWTVLGIALFALTVAGLFGSIAFLFLRFSVTGPKISPSR